MFQSKEKNERSVNTIFIRDEFIVHQDARWMRVRNRVFAHKTVNGIVLSARNRKRIHWTTVSNGILFTLLYCAQPKSNHMHCMRDGKAIVLPFNAITYSVPFSARQRFNSFKFLVELQRTFVRYHQYVLCYSSNGSYVI